MEDENRIKEILMGLQAPEKQPGLARTLLTAIPQAIATFFSPNPSQTLTNQLEQKSQEQERDKERRQRLDQLGAQLQIEDIMGRAKEKRAEETQIRAEQRGEQRQIGAESRADFREVARFNRESGFQEKLNNISFGQQKSLLAIKQSYDIENNKTQFANQQALENLRSSNNITEQKIGQELGFVLPLMYSGEFSGKDASNIYHKIASGQSLTPDEDARISRADKLLRQEKYRHELNVALAHSRAGSQESPVTKGLEWAMNSARATNLGTDAQGNIVELQKDMLGSLTLPDGTKPTKYLSEDQEVQYYYGKYRMVHPEAPNVYQQQTEVPDEKAVGLSIDQAIQEARNERRSDSEIYQRLTDPQVQAKLRATPQQIQQAMERNKINPQNSSSGQSSIEQKTFNESPLGKAISTVSDWLKIQNNPQLSNEIEAIYGRGQSRAEAQAKVTAAQAEVNANKEKFDAAKTVNYLTERLQEVTSVKNKKVYKDNAAIRKVNDETESDLRRRLEDAYKAHPELRPK